MFASSSRNFADTVRWRPVHCRVIRRFAPSRSGNQLGTLRCAIRPSIYCLCIRRCSRSHFDKLHCKRLLGHPWVHLLCRQRSPCGALLLIVEDDHRDTACLKYGCRKVDKKVAFYAIIHHNLPKVLSRQGFLIRNLVHQRQDAVNEVFGIVLNLPHSVQYGCKEHKANELGEVVRLKHEVVLHGIILVAALW